MKELFPGNIVSEEGGRRTSKNVGETFVFHPVRKKSSYNYKDVLTNEEVFTKPKLPNEEAKKTVKTQEFVPNLNGGKSNKIKIQTLVEAKRDIENMSNQIAVGKEYFPDLSVGKVLKKNVLSKPVNEIHDCVTIENLPITDLSVGAGITPRILIKPDKQIHNINQNFSELSSRSKKEMKILMQPKHEILDQECPPFLAGWEKALEPKLILNAKHRIKDLEEYIDDEKAFSRHLVKDDIQSESFKVLDDCVPLTRRRKKRKKKERKEDETWSEDENDIQEERLIQSFESCTIGEQFSYESEINNSVSDTSSEQDQDPEDKRWDPNRVCFVSDSQNTYYDQFLLKWLPDDLENGYFSTQEEEILSSNEEVLTSEEEPSSDEDGQEAEISEDAHIERNEDYENETYKTVHANTEFNLHRHCGDKDLHQQINIERTQHTISTFRYTRDMKKKCTRLGLSLVRGINRQDNYIGVFIQEVLTESPLKGWLNPGDELLRINSKHLRYVIADKQIFSSLFYNFSDMSLKKALKTLDQIKLGRIDILTKTSKSLGNIEIFEKEISMTGKVLYF